MPITPTFAGPMGGVVASGSPIVFNVDVDYFDVEKLYDLVVEKTSGASLLMFLTEEAHQYFSAQIGRRFLTEGDAKSGAWEQLTDATQDIRSAMGVPPAHPINIRTALLGNRDSLFEFVTEHYEVRAGPDWAELEVPGHPDPIQEAKLQTAQLGSTTNPLGYGDTPPRPVLADATEEDLQELLALLEGFVMVQVAGALA